MEFAPRFVDARSWSPWPPFCWPVWPWSKSFVRTLLPSLFKRHLDMNYRPKLAQILWSNPRTSIDSYWTIENLCPYFHIMILVCRNQLWPSTTRGHRSPIAPQNMNFSKFVDYCLKSFEGQRLSIIHYRYYRCFSIVGQFENLLQKSRRSWRQIF